jgi:hypothetical protein
VFRSRVPLLLLTFRFMSVRVQPWFPAALPTQAIRAIREIRGQKVPVPRLPPFSCGSVFRSRVALLLLTFRFVSIRVHSWFPAALRTQAIRAIREIRGFSIQITNTH